MRGRHGTIPLVDVASGQLKLRVKIEGGRARETTFQNVPAFCPMTDVPVDVAGLGTIKMDVAYGGNFFGIVAAEDAGVEIRPERVRHLAKVAIEIREAANRQLDIRHPTQPHLKGIPLISFQAKPTRAGPRYLNPNPKIDGA